MLPLLPTRIHGVIDYLWGVLAIASPYIFGFANQGAAHWLLMAAGVATLGMSLLTNYEVALVRLLPMPVHLAADVTTGLFLAASPWLFGFGDREAAVVLVLGCTSVVAGLTTRTRAVISAEQQESTRPEPGRPESRTLATDRIFALAVTAVGLIIAVAFGWSAMIDIVQQNAVDPRQIGAPVPWQLNFPLPHTPVQDALFRLHNLLFVISIGITLLVTVLVVYVVFRFRASRNPEPARTTHNAPLEVVWTVVPVLILVFIAIPTFRNLKLIENTPQAEMTLKVTGRQWSWDYTYPDHGGFTFNALMVPENDLPAEDKGLRLMRTDNVVVLPVDTVIRVQLTAADVIHAWGVPSLGVMRDAIPGRLNETWTRIEREGFYYGACRELCGTNHAFMPITIQAVSKEAFATWVAEARTRFAAGGGVSLARADETANVDQKKGERR